MYPACSWKVELRGQESKQGDQAESSGEVQGGLDPGVDNDDKQRGCREWDGFETYLDVNL